MLNRCSPEFVAIELFRKGYKVIKHATWIEGRKDNKQIAIAISEDGDCRQAELEAAK